PQPSGRRAAMSAWSAAGAVAGASGFMVGGAVTQIIGWRAMFWLNLPLALVIATGVVARVSGSRRSDPPRLHLARGLLFSAGVAGLVLGASVVQPPGHPELGLVAIGGGALLLAVVVGVERHAEHPLIPRDGLRHRSLRVGAAAAFLNTATTSSAAAIATLELQRVQHLSPAAAGLRLLPLSFGAIAGAALASPTLRRLPAQGTIALGLAVIGLADIGLIALHHAGWLLPAPVSVMGVGLGVSSVAANALGTDVGASLQAAAAGVLNTAAQLGTALGVAVLLLLSATGASLAFPLSGPLLGWAAAAALALAGAAIIAARPLRSRRRGSGTASPSSPAPPPRRQRPGTASPGR
ncbi:MAG: MFS transporter, partial [Solirubrobacteraceae bacterium]